jgi:hypothetical protein
MIYVGIDNGLTGGLVALSDHAGPPIDMIAMPTRKRGKFKEIDGAAVTLWIRNVVQTQNCTVIIEDCPQHARQKSTMRSMAVSYGILVGSISAGCPAFRLLIVRSGNPKDSWQRNMLGSLAQGGTKEAAHIAAKELWPDENWLKNSKCTTPDTGLIDAALIAEYGRLMKL